MKIWCVNGIWEWGEDGESFDLFTTYEKARIYAVELAYKNSLKNEEDNIDSWSSKNDCDRDIINIYEVEVK
jgi:hypothetical protein